MRLSFLLNFSFQHLRLLGEFYYRPPLFIKVSLAAGGELMRCSGLRLQPGLECVFTCCPAQLRGMCEGVWRQSGRVCDLKRLNGGGSAPLPFHPHSPFPDKRKSHSLGQMVPNLSRSPFLHPFHPRVLACRSLQCDSLSLFLHHHHSASVVWRWDWRPSRTVSPGRQRILIEKEIRNETSHPFFRPLFRESAEAHQGKENEMWS